MSKVKDYTKLIIGEEDVLVKVECIKSGTSLLLPDDASEQAKEEAGGLWSDPEIIKAGNGVKTWDVGMIIIVKKQEYPIIWISDEDDGVSPTVGTVRYYTFPARLIDMAVETNNYTKPIVNEL